MKFSIISKVIFLVSLCHIAVQGQSLIAIDGDVNFPSTTELQASTETIRLYNPNSFPITVDAVDRFEIYGNRVFSASDSQFTVLPSDTFSLTVSFLPEHNVLHEQVLVFKSKSGFGHTKVGLNGQGSYSRSYYSTTENKSQEALKNALDSRLAQGYNDLGYSGARDQMYATIDNNNGQVECVYTGRTATFNTRAGANSNTFNCEHTFPQGFFNSNVPMRSDIHHLFPTDVSANSRRGNDPFGVVSSASWTMGGSKSGGGKFEPRDAQKGATARAMMYFVIRYQDYSSHFSGQESILRQWHQQFPPSAAEKARNAAIYNVQNNRNPFVDYPQFVERISDIDGTASANSITELYASDDTIKLASGSNLSRSYTFVLYNSGTESVSLGGFSLSDPNLSFANGNPGTLSLAAGQSLSLDINFMTNINYQTSLNYQVSGGIGLKSVPVISGPGLSVSDFDFEELPQFFPNPSKGLVHLQNYRAIKKLSLVDASGKEWSLEAQAILDLSHLPKGHYTFRIVLKEDNSLYTQKLILN